MTEESQSYAIEVNCLNKTFLVYEKPSDKLLEVILGLTKGRRFTAVSDVSFKVKKGESVGIIGLNGAGKSTLLQMIVGTLNPSSGSCSVNGRISALLELGAGFNPEYTGLENIYLNAALLGLSKSEVTSKLDSIIAFADIGDHINQPVKTYSSGMFVRLAFAVSAHVDPEILIVDEALSVGDVLFQQKCFAHLNGPLKDTTKLFVTHDFATLSMVAERSIVLHKGKVLFDGKTKEAIKHYHDVIHAGSNLSSVSDDLSLSKSKSEENIISYSNLIPIDEKYLSGIRDYEIKSWAFHVNGSNSRIVNHGDRVGIDVFISKTKKANIDGKAVIGFFLRDRLGQKVFGQNTLSLDDNIDLSDDSLVKFEFEWPRIASGDYSITLGLGFIDKVNDIVHDVQCWANDFDVISCVTTHIEHGILSVDIDKLEVLKNAIE